MDCDGREPRIIHICLPVRTQDYFERNTYDFKLKMYDEYEVPYKKHTIKKKD